MLGGGEGMGLRVSVISYSLTKRSIVTLDEDPKCTCRCSTGDEVPCMVSDLLNAACANGWLLSQYVCVWIFYNNFVSKITKFVLLC